MTTRKVRGYGSFDDIPRKDALSFPLQPHLDGETMGFRLALDNSMRRVNGSSSHYPPRVARRSGTDNLHPEEANEVSGIRLVADWVDT